MSYLISVDRHQGDNLPGIVEMRIVRAAEVISIPRPVNGVIPGNPSYVGGYNQVTWRATLSTTRIQTGSNTTREGTSKRNTLSFIVPKDRPELRHVMERMQDDEFIVELRYPNGQRKLFGLKEAPVQFAFEHDSGADFGDRNAYDCRFYYQGPENIYFLPDDTGVFDFTFDTTFN